MLIRLIKNPDNSKLPKNLEGEPVTLCDDGSEKFDKKDLREERDIELGKLKLFFDHFDEERNSLPDDAASFKNKALLAANFPVTDLERIIDQNKGNLSFLRLYLGIDDEKNHILCIAPVDKNKKVITADGTIYTIQCCGYPPHTKNFKGDPILGL